MPRIERTIHIAAPLATVQAVIEDYARYPEFVPHMTRAEIIDTRGTTRRVRFTLDLVAPVRYTLDLTAREGGGLDWTLVDGPFERNEGGWRLDETGEGTTRASYFIDVELKGHLPRFVEQRLIARSLPANLHAFRDEAERRR